MTQEIDWSHYRSLLAVLRSGSLSAAARELGVSQPTIGRHIDALEQLAGNPLFVRSQHGLLPTPAALQMRPHAETMEASAAAMRRAASGTAGTISGSVRISCSEIIGVEVLPAVIAALQDEHTQLEIELSVTDDTEDLLQNKADIAVRMVAPKQDALVARSIGAIPIGAYATRDYLKRFGEPTSLDDLRHHRLIGFDREFAYVRETLRQVPQLQTLEFAVRTDSNLAQLAMLRAGGGIGFCQRGIARRDDALVAILPDDLSLSLDTYVVIHEALRHAPRCRVVFDALVESLMTYAKT